MNAPYLSVTTGLPSKVFPLTPGAFVAGRSPDADLPLPHPEISRQHCRFTWDGQSCRIEDLGSAHGTFVNEVRLAAPATLKPGDKVGIGPAILEFGLGKLPKIEKREAGVQCAPAGMMARGIAVDRIKIDRLLTFGREPGVEVHLDDPSVSRKHASAGPGPSGGVIMTDLDSTTGSFVNGRRFHSCDLTIGDRLQIGPFYFQFDGRALNRVANAAGGAIMAAGVIFSSDSFVILDDIRLTIPPSRFVGIIGPSGAGKSSLLSTLSGLRAPEAGSVFVDGRDIYQGHDTRSFGFVPQEDIVHGELTVVQALQYSARLRLPADSPPLEIQKLILQTIDQLGLRPHAIKPISLLSGGQRKRVSVGVELLAKPAVLFLDEPGSGLDPATEFKLMELLRDLADMGCTVVCTTHVMENAYLMDQLIVLVGGCLAFQGSSQSARAYFNVPKLTDLYDRLAIRPPKEWQRAFHEQHCANADAAPEVAPGAAAMPARHAFALPILLARQWAILKSDWRNFVILIGQPLIIAGLVAWVGNDDWPLLMFFDYLAALWFGCSNAAQVIVREIAIYRRERLVGVSTHAYLASKFLFLIAITAIQAILLYATTIMATGSRDGSVAFQIASLLGAAIAGVGIGTAVSALSRSEMQAVMLVPLILIPQIVFSGFTVRPSRMSKCALTVSRLMPTFSAQTVMDTSFLWKKELGSKLEPYQMLSLRNLDPDRHVSTGSVYDRERPAAFALLGLVLWTIGSYTVAWIRLKYRERV